MRNNLLLTTALLLDPGLFAQWNPSFYWTLDEIGGTIANDAMGQSNGLLQGNTTWQPTGGQFAGALRFYGNDARVDLGPCDITTGSGEELTLACWFKPEIMAGTERVLMAKAIGGNASDMMWSLSLVNSTGARFRVNAGGTTHTVEVPPSSIFTNAWYHLAAVYDGSDIRVFLNGSTSATGVASGTIGYHPEAPATLGNLFDNSLPFYGSLDDVRIYDRALSGLEVIDLVLGLNTGMTAPPAVVWNGAGFHLENTGWRNMRVLDLSGRELHYQRIAEEAVQATSPALPAGCYLVCLQGDGRSHTQRVLVP